VVNWEPDFEPDETGSGFIEKFAFLIVGCVLLLVMFLGAAVILMFALQYPIVWVFVAGIALWAWWWVNKPNI